MHLYIFVRKDLSPAQIAVQASHAAIESARSCIPVDMTHPSIVLLGIRNLQELNRALIKIQSLGIKTYPFYEEDRDNELTAFATEPISEQQRSLFRRFNCLNDSSFNQQEKLCQNI